MASSSWPASSKGHIPVVQAYTAVGAQPTPMAYGEVFLAMQNGVVDALEVSSDAMVADRFIK